MRTVYVMLSGQQQVQHFVEALNHLAGNFDLKDGSFILDARSLMGIFSLDLSKPIRLDIEHDSEETMQALAPYIVDAPANK